MAKVHWVCCILMLSLSMAFAGEASTPEQVTAEYFREAQKGGLVATLGITHSDAMTALKKLLAPIFEAEHAKGQQRLTQAILGTGATYDTYKNTAPSKLMKSYLFLVDGVTKIQYTNAEVLGKVMEGEVCHVLARVRVSTSLGSTTRMQVVSLKQESGEWRVLLTSELTAVAEGLRASVMK